jgi:hypothetical protein
MIIAALLAMFIAVLIVGILIGVGIGRDDERARQHEDLERRDRLWPNPSFPRVLR